MDYTNRDLLNKILEIRDENSTNKKIELLKELYLMDSRIIDLFTKSLSPFYNIYIKKFNKDIPERELDINEKRMKFPEFYVIFTDILNDLNSRNITGNKAREVVERFYKLVKPYKLFDLLFNMVMNKDLKLGINIKSHNKVVKQLSKQNKELKKYLIPESFAMLASDSKFGTQKIKTNIDYIVEYKFDGVRCLTFIDEIKMISRNGKRYNVFENHFKKYLEILKDEMDKKGLQNLILDGEMLDANNNFTNISGLGHSKYIDDINIKYVIFDILEEDDYNDVNKKTLKQRRENLLKLNDIIKNNKELNKVFDISINVLGEGNYLRLKDINEIYPLFDKLVEEHKNKFGFYPEGIMLKDINSLYEKKRTNTWLKMKKMKTIDLKIIDFEEGTGKLKNSLGAMICEDKDGNKVRVGSGFTEDKRKLYWEQRNNIKGCIVEVKFQEVTTNKNDNSLSVRFPVFNRIRDDKTEPDKIKSFLD
jgi:DNA ligase-1